MQGRLVVADGICSVSDYVATMQRAPSVLTLHQTLSARLALSSLDELELRVQRDQSRTTALNRILQDNPKLNYRQRGILLRALQVPFAEFNIRYHQQAHSIAYTTARRDLLALSECGYLRVVQRGKSFVFLPNTSIDEIRHQESIG
jgi:Fic family protein